MAINKVEYGGDTLIDITDTTANAGDVVQGKTFYTADGNRATGTYNETDPTVPSYVKSITQANITSWNNKIGFSEWDTNNHAYKVLHGSNLTSLLSIDSNNKIDILNIPTANSITDDWSSVPITAMVNNSLNTKQNKITSSNKLDYSLLDNTPTVPDKTSDLTNDSGFITTESDPVFMGSPAANILTSDLTNWNNKQDTLVSGTNIKTINSQSIVGSGNVDFYGTELPIGTEVDYDGTTVPTGWQEINEKATILWTNPNPSSSFAAQNIVLSSDDYDILKIFFKKTANENRITSLETIKGFGIDLHYIDDSCAMFSRGMSRVNDTTFSLAGAKYKLASSTSTVNDNSRCVPIYIVGYKTGLF